MDESKLFNNPILNDDRMLIESFGYLFEKANVFCLVFSEDGVIAAANTYAMKFTGRELVGDSFKDVVIDFHDKLNLKDLAAGTRQEQLLNIDGATGLPQSFHFTFREVGDRILALGRLDAEELERMRKEVVILNQELTNLTRELHRKNAQLKKLNEEKNHFLGMAAHDLRKPIGLIISYSEFLLDEAKEALSSEHIGFLNTINGSCTFMKRLVDDFLDISAIEAGRFELDIQKASIMEVLARSLELNDLQAMRKEVELVIDTDDALPRFLMDAPKIEQAITNLVSNAIEHSDPKSRVFISLIENSDTVTFQVRDEGPGIPDDERDKLFKPFEKTRIKKTGGEKSTGLGMVIIRKIVEAHGGSIWLDSRLNEGTTIAFSLPIDREAI